ncbi:MAG: hypothetical protein S4CHLAM2_03320 [Chlamydiales bacterium]|nr:hypothetical protein [Chlamydiales bacterium]
MLTHIHRESRPWIDPEIVKNTKRTAAVVIALAAITAAFATGAYIFSLWASHGGLAPLGHLLNAKQNLNIAQILCCIVAPTAGTTTLLIVLGRVAAKRLNKQPPANKSEQRATETPQPASLIDVDAEDTDDESDSWRDAG